MVQIIHTVLYIYSHVADKAAASSGAAGNALNAFDKLVKENLDSELETLVALDKKFRDNSGSATSGDVGPIFDIIR